MPASGPSASAEQAVVERLAGGARHTAGDAQALCNADLGSLIAAAQAIRDAGSGNVISYSPKVFIPLTKLCRDSCHYCSFARPAHPNESLFLDPEAVLAVARAGEKAGCTEALFTLGDKPELRYRVAREELARRGHESTLSYLHAMADLVRRETRLLPHLNAGVMTRADFERLREVSVSQGIMLETTSERLSRRGGPHFGSPDKLPAVRLAAIAAAGEAAVPLTSGILIGIGETRLERIEALLALRDLDAQFGHIQEIIVQNFRAKPGTRMAAAREPSLEDHLWTVAVARILFGPAMSIQAPPNLSPEALTLLIEAGISDWGGISPVTPDHVNPEAPWPEIEVLREKTALAGKLLTARLPVYPGYVREAGRWIDSSFHSAVLKATDSEGFARADGWTAGTTMELPEWPRRRARSPGGAADDRLERIIGSALAGAELSEDDIVRLFEARGEAAGRVCEAADELRRHVCREEVTYVVTRNVNYTNVCYFRCQFCAFSKGKLSENLRGRPYNLGLSEIRRRTREAWDRGATEICLQGGIHPEYTGATYLSILEAVKEACPDIHVHAFSPLEIWQGAATLKCSVRAFLAELRSAGLGSLPGTAAEVLDDDVRRIICPDKLNSEQWLAVVEAAHEMGLCTTSTIMFGHVDHPRNWARHLRRLRALQQRTGGITEFVPLPFVPMETPLYLKGRARRGPTLREAVLMHAVGRLALHPLVMNVQTSWVKMGAEGARLCLQAGANDLGGTLMNETISRAAGAAHGQEMSPERMEALILSLGRRPRQRTTLYGTATAERRAASFGAAPLQELVDSTAARYASAQSRGPLP